MKITYKNFWELISMSKSNEEIAKDCYAVYEQAIQGMLDEASVELPSEEFIEHKAQIATNDEDYYNYPHVFWKDAAMWMKSEAYKVIMVLRQQLKEQKQLWIDECAETRKLNKEIQELKGETLKTIYAPSEEAVIGFATWLWKEIWDARIESKSNGKWYYQKTDSVVTMSELFSEYKQQNGVTKSL